MGNTLAISSLSHVLSRPITSADMASSMPADIANMLSKGLWSVMFPRTDPQGPASAALAPPSAASPSSAAPDPVSAAVAHPSGCFRTVRPLPRRPAAAVPSDRELSGRRLTLRPPQPSSATLGCRRCRPAASVPSSRQGDGAGLSWVAAAAGNPLPALGCKLCHTCTGSCCFAITRSKRCWSVMSPRAGHPGTALRIGCTAA